MKATITRTAQRWLFPEFEEGQKSTVNGSTQAARFSTYIHSREALWRLIASYPPQMPVVEALQRARVDFTKASVVRPLTARCQRDARKEVAV